MDVNAHLLGEGVGPYLGDHLLSAIVLHLPLTRIYVTSARGSKTRIQLDKYLLRAWLVDSLLTAEG